MQVYQIYFSSLPISNNELIFVPRHYLGRSQRNTAEDTSLAETRQLFELNFFSVVNLAKIVLPVFLTQKSGQFVVISSVSGKLGTPIGSSYSGTKFALVSKYNFGHSNIIIYFIFKS